MKAEIWSFETKKAPQKKRGLNFITGFLIYENRLQPIKRYP